MSVEKLKRVMWRLAEKAPPNDVVTRLALERAIMIEIGTDPKTIKNTKFALVKIGWIEHWRHKYKLIRIFETEDYIC